MSSATPEEWTAALAAWEGLDESQRNYALGYMASGEPQLLITAAAEAMVITRQAPATAAPATAAPATAAPAAVAAANLAVAALDRFGMRDVLDFLATYHPDMILLAVHQTGN